MLAKLLEPLWTFSAKYFLAMTVASDAEAPESRMALAAASAAASAAATILVLACMPRPKSTARPVVRTQIETVSAKMTATVPSSDLVKDLSVWFLVSMAISP